MNLKKKKILVTGGNGFIGQNLKDRFVSFGAHVDSYDIENGQDICNKSLIRKTIKNQYDYVYHLAAFSGSQKSLNSHGQCMKTNALATVLILDAIVDLSPTTKIITSGSRLEYGIPQYLPVDENHPTEPNSPYGLSKLICSQMAKVYGDTRNLKFTAFRTSNVYGPHHNSRFAGYNLINYLIDLAKNNKGLSVFGDGKQLRDYLFIDDLIDAFVLALNPKSNNKIYNLGYGKGISLMDMTKLIVDTVGKGKIQKVAWPQDWKSIETGSYASDITKIKKELGFKPKINFKDGIKKTIENT